MSPWPKIKSLCLVAGFALLAGPAFPAGVPLYQPIVQGDMNANGGRVTNALQVVASNLNASASITLAGDLRTAWPSITNSAALTNKDTRAWTNNTGIYGNGLGLTNIPGSGLQSASINSNRLDAATVALFTAGASGGGGGTGIATNSGSGTNNVFINPYFETQDSNGIQTNQAGAYLFGPIGSGSSIGTGNDDGSGIWGGIGNTIPNSGGQAASIVGGTDNLNDGRGSIILDGEDNTLQHNVIGGSDFNAFYAVILAGQSNVLSGNFSIAGGLNANVTNAGCFVYAGSQATRFSSKTNNTVLFRALNGVGINTNYPGNNALKVVGNIDATSISVNGTSITSGLGYTIAVCGGGTGFTPADGTTYYLGANFLNGVLDTANDYARIEIPKAGTIKRMFLKISQITTSGTSETVNHYIRLNNTTDIANVTGSYSTGQLETTVTASTAVVAGDYITVKIVTPTWVTNPVGVVFYGLIYIE